MYRKYNEPSIENNDCNYWIPAIFTQSIVMPQKDGVIYQSVQSRDHKIKNNLCVTIKPSSVDNKLECVNMIDICQVLDNNQATVYPRQRTNFR